MLQFEPLIKDNSFFHIIIKQRKPQTKHISQYCNISFVCPDKADVVIYNNILHKSTRKLLGTVLYFTANTLGHAIQKIIHETIKSTKLF